MTDNNPKAFISYSHDSEEHKAWVLKLAIKLRENGVDVIFDRWDAKLGEDLVVFMEKGVREADRVVVVCSQNYVVKADDGKGGVGYEKMLLTKELIEDLGTNKFIPIIRNNATKKPLPDCFGTRRFLNFNEDSSFSDCFDELIHEIHGQEFLKKPPIGKSPFSKNTSSLKKDPVVVNGPDEIWLGENRASASSELSALGISMRWEITSHAPQGNLNANQKDLFNFAKNSNIETFGWPIGVFLENTDARPVPKQTGIVASVVREETPMYDYWAWSNSGQFYLQKSIFEDQRDPGAIFFNTRICRTTEALMYLANMYDALGLPKESPIVVQNRYTGFFNRTMKSTGTRLIDDNHVASEDSVFSEITVSLADIQNDLVQPVKLILQPFFVLFNFFELHDKVYKDIVVNFIKGKCT